MSPGLHDPKPWTYESPTGECSSIDGLTRWEIDALKRKPKATRSSRKYEQPRVPFWRSFGVNK